MTRKALQKLGAGRPPTGHVTVLVALRPDQRETLVAAAEERRKPGQRLPFSEVTREALDRGLGIRGPLTPRPPPPVAVRVKVKRRPIKRRK